MATVQKRNGNYRIRVSCGYAANGKQIQRTKTWKPDKNMTERQIKNELERQKALFTNECKGLSANANIKFEPFAEQWLNEYAKPRLKVRTIDRYKQYAGRAYKAIGNLRIDKINSRHIQKFVDSLKGLSSKTIRGYVSFISTIFDYAVKQGMIKDNPCKNIALPPLKQAQRECYTLEEAQQFLGLLEKEPIKYRTLFTLAVYSGLRKGEMLGLEWKDIDFENCVIAVNRASLYSKTKGGTFMDAPKTKQSQRALKLPAQMISLLRQYRLSQSKERLKCGTGWESDNVFTTGNGKPMGTSTPLKWLDNFFERTGTRKVTMHSLRHLNASLLINAGADVKTVSAALGHSKASTTLNIYTHEFQEAQAKASQAVADVLSI